jgi:hypothetical protein
VQVRFAGRVVEWRGPAPYRFVALPGPAADDVREVAAAASYGWGAVPVEASIGGIAFTTSLFPKDGGYLLPLRDAVRGSLGVDVGDEVSVELRVRLDRGG